MNYSETINKIIETLTSVTLESAKEDEVPFDFYEHCTFDGKGFDSLAADLFIEKIEGDDKAKEDAINAIFDSDTIDTFGKNESNDELISVLSSLIK